MNRLHKNLVWAIVQGLDQIINQEKQADKVVETLLKSNARWGARDRGFIASTLYEIIRYRRLYEAIAEVKKPFSKEDRFRIFGVWAILRGYALPDWPELQGTPSRRIKGKFEQLRKQRVYRESFPDWLDQRCVQELGEDRWNREAAALNKEAELVLRANTLKGVPADLRSVFKNKEIEIHGVKEVPEALVLKNRLNVFRMEEFKAGLFEVQDVNSQRVAHFVDPKPGERIIDACAGAGGKSLHLAALMQNKGQLLGMDIYPAKLKELKRRCRRAGVHNLETRLIDSSKVIKKLKGSADRVLIDAPCSGLGVLKRNPDTKWKLQEDFLEKVQQRQRDILQQYSGWVKSGGTLVYATCSILPSENQDQVAYFLNSEAGEFFQLVEDKTLYPSDSDFDGFYMAKLLKE